VAARIVQIGKELQSRIREFFDQTPGTDATPLEIREAVLEDIERRIQPVGRGRRVLPYSRIRVQAILRHADRPSFEAAFQEIQAQVRERLAELRCEIPQDLDVQASFLSEPPEGWIAGRLFAVEYLASEPSPKTPVARPRPDSVRVAVVKGQASSSSYLFSAGDISIGRTPEPEDHLGRVRRNQVVFLDLTDGITETVGRAHARLRWDSEAGEYRLYDEGSRNGTAILRGGISMPVPSQDPRGVRVESGDEIQLGRALIQVSFE
jgi:hypothetical protein